MVSIYSVTFEKLPRNKAAAWYLMRTYPTRPYDYEVVAKFVSEEAACDFLRSLSQGNEVLDAENIVARSKLRSFTGARRAAEGGKQDA